MRTKEHAGRGSAAPARRIHQGHVYKRRQWENIWLRTKRYDANHKVVGASGGVCYLYFPARVTPRQRRALASVGVI